MGVWEIRMTFITKVDWKVDVSKLKADLETILTHCPWPEEDFEKKTSGNQIGLTHRPGAEFPWLDASGSLANRETGEIYAKESDFTVINELVPEYTKKIIESLSKHLSTSFGRIRIMRLMPKTGLSIHADMEQRYHFVLDTNPYALFGNYTGNSEMQAECFHIPADGFCYKVDTTKPHFVYNGGWEPRIHLVICEA
jgi:hypothetical protein